MASEILKEFLVLIGYRNDEQAVKKTFESVQKLEKSLIAVTLAAEAAALAIVDALGKAANSFEKLYYASERTGSSVQNLKAFGYAIGQVGGNAESAMASVENLARRIRENPGFGNLLREKFGIDPKDAEKAAVELGKRLSTMPYYKAKQFGDMFGIDENLLLAMTKHGPEVAAFMDDYNRKAGAMGVNLQQAAKDGKDLSQRLRDVKASLDLIVDAADTPLFQRLDEPLKNLNAFLEKNGKDIADILGKIAGALLKLFTSVLEHLPDLDHLAERMGGWENAFAGLAAVISVALVGRLVGMLGALGGMSRLIMPPWLLALLGVGAGVSWGLNKLHEGAKAENMPSWEESGKPTAADGFWGKVKQFGSSIFGGGGGAGGGGGPQRGGIAKGGWWTPENQKHAFDRLTAGGMNPTAAIALISRWKNVESTGAGPNASNNLGGGHWGIAQMDRRRWAKVGGSKGIDDQLDAVLEEYKTGAGDGAGPKASRVLAGAKSDREGATGASAYERAEQYDPSTGRDAYTDTTERGMAEVRRNVMPQKTPPMLKPGALKGSPGVVPSDHPLYPGATIFNPSVAAPPLGSQSSNDNSRSVVINDNSKTTVNGVSEPEKAADHIGRIGDRQSSLLLRNLQSAVG